MKIKTVLRDTLATIIAKIMQRFAFDPRYFELWQQHKYHVLPVHFYSTIPNTLEIESKLFEKESSLCGISINEESQIRMLGEFKKTYMNEYDKFVDRTLHSSPSQFSFGNISFESVDAEMLYCMVRRYKPKHVIEIGSGFTTLITAEALAVNKSEGKDSRFTAIEPFPSSFLRNPLGFEVDLKPQKVQQVPLSFFSQLGDGDILFIDSSHVVKIGSDTQYEFLEILPSLAPGVIVHVHDIFLPKEYPKDWVIGKHRFWNEQYILQAFLTGNRDWEVLWAAAFMHYRHPEKLSSAFRSYNRFKNLPGSFWIRRRP
jgi:hypothetical protein